MAKDTGWKPIPLSLKFVFVLSILWVLGTFFAVQMRFEQGVPFLGFFIYGVSAVAIVILLDIIAPLAFLHSIWHRRSWGPKLAFIYMGFFIINSLVAFTMFAEQLGGPAILVPAAVQTIMLIIIYKNRSHFK